MRTRIAAALGLAAGLIAAPVFAQQGTTTTRGVHPVPPAEAVTSPTPHAAPAESPPAMAAGTTHHVMHHVVHHPMHVMVMHHPMHAMAMHHPMMMHHGMAHAAMAPGDREHMSVEQLNNMSLQAAKQGQNFAPPAGK